MYDKKTKPLRACVPVDPFGRVCVGREAREREGGRMEPITAENVAHVVALDFGA